jgi:CubicO group peptidase (beta-lactamase class C family)
MSLGKNPPLSSGDRLGFSFNAASSTIDSLLSITRGPGLSCGVLRHGEVLMSLGFGFKNVSTGSKSTDRTIYGIGSMTKSFTAAACGLLVADGKLNWGMFLC